MAEKQLIDASQENIKSVLGNYPYYPDEIWKFSAMAERFPTVDAVEVVRCKGCEHWNELKGKDSGKPVGYGYCRNLCGINGIAYEDSFCSYGERRTDA